jgi:hypothetical protein
MSLEAGRKGRTTLAASKIVPGHCCCLQRNSTLFFWWEIFTRQNGYFKGMVYSLRTGESLSINWDFASQNGDLIVMRLTTQNISVFQ